MNNQVITYMLSHVSIHLLKYFQTSVVPVSKTDTET